MNENTPTAISRTPQPAAAAASSTNRTQAQEKRLKRTRNSCPAAIQQRIDRARRQQMFLIKREEVNINDLSCEFIVLGSTGNVYTVTIQRLPHCTCPDHARGNLCKHILFVLLKVMALDPNSNLIFQAAWTGQELESMYKQMRVRFRQVSGTVLANETVRNTFAQMSMMIDGDEGSANHAAMIIKEQGQGQGQEERIENIEARRRQKQEEGDDCPICFDVLGDLTRSENTTYCRGRCGANFHQVCIRHWLNQNRTNPTCPMCREPWLDDKKRCAAAAAVAANTSATTENIEGYTNLGRLQGQSPDRDTSTYNYNSRSSWWSSSDGGGGGGGRRKRSRRW